MRSVMHHAEHGSSTTAVCTLRSDGLDYDSRETLWQMTPFARPARTCPFGKTVHERLAQTRT